jgi:subtilase family serine protease
MFRNRWVYAIFSLIIPLLIGGFVALKSQTTGRELIRESVDENKLVTLAGNTRSEALSANDQGPVSDDFAMDHMLLQLKRSPQQERIVEQLIADLHNPQSRAFHKWLTAEAFGKSYGAAESDLRTITDWLHARGFTVNFVYPSGMVIDFSGTAGQVRDAFHTTIHNLDVNGVHHIANVADPQIPHALAPAVAGVVSMHDFIPHKMALAKVKKSGAQYTFAYQGQTYQAVVPADLATIYDINPLYASGITGKGQTVVVIEDTDLYTPRRGSSDWATFRSEFGLAQYTSGSLTTVHPTPASGGNNCTDPGVTSDDVEAIIDAEWATAAAPGAVVEVASCANTSVTSGLLIAGQNLVNAPTPPSIISISYGECEAYNGASQNASIDSLYQQAVAEGVSVFVSAGDEGPASCDAGASLATHGLGISALAATQYNVAAGGTDFSDTANGTAGTYWSQTNTATYGSALSYIPEMPWDYSCANSVLAKFNGYTTVYGSSGFCNSSIANTDGFNMVVGGSGGPSNCFTGVPSISGVASGTCQGYPKPAWQTGLSGIPNDGVRDIPDVSMFAANGLWGHYSVVCFSDPSSTDSAPCTGSPSNWAGFGGTSIASPVLAGIQALVNQNAGGPQGNPNPVYYGLIMT